MEQEKLIKKALKAIGKSETPTVAATARKFGVATRTLYRRHQGISRSRKEAHEHQMNLTVAHEGAVVSWIAGLTATGFPPSKAILQNRIEKVKLMLNSGSPPLGKNYIATFISRHPELGYGYASRRDKNRAIKGAKSIYQDFFDKVSLDIRVLVAKVNFMIQWSKTITEHNIQRENIYNMDEKGFLLGLGARTKIIYARDFGRKVLLQGKVDLL
jgi:hypothetical protein